jgi:hypothetical protein
MSRLTVKVDDRLRLVTAVLAASQWPDEEQAQLTHAVHPHAKQTRHYMIPFSDHPAVRNTNRALANDVTLTDLFSAALRCRWPKFTPAEPLPEVSDIETWVAALADFAADTAVVTDFWPQHKKSWQEAVKALKAILKGNHLLDFLEALQGNPLPQNIIVMPNLVYPALSPVVATAKKTTGLLLPPPKAVGESPPWPYSDGPGWVVATTCFHLVSHLFAGLLAPLDETQQATIKRAATTLCLAEVFDEFEAQAYLVRIKKEYNLPDLPDVVEKMRANLQKGSDLQSFISLR